MALRLFRQIARCICTSVLAAYSGDCQRVQRGQIQSQREPSAGSASLRTRLWRTAAAMLSISLASLTPALQAQLARYDTPGVYRYTVPSGYKELEITIAGAGGGRGADDPGFNGSAGGAGGPGSLQRFKIKAIPGLVLEFVVGHPGENGVFAPHTEYRRALGGLTGDGQKRGGPGGLGYDKNGFPTAGGGGGGAATFVRVVSSPQIYRNRLLSVAGGGGGGQGGIDNNENYLDPVKPGYWIPTHYFNQACALETHGLSGAIFSGRNRGSGGGGVGMGQSWYSSENNPPVFVYYKPEEGWGRASDFPAIAGKPAESGGVCVARDLPDGISSNPVLPLVTQVYATPTPTPIDTRSYHGNNGERSGWVNIGNVGGDPPPPPPPPGGAGPKLKIGMISNDVGGSFRFTGDNGWQPSTITTKANVLTWSQQQTLASNSSATRIQPGFMDKWDIIGLNCFIRGGAELNLQRFPDGSWEIPTSGVQSNKEIECFLSASERSKAQSAKFRMTLTSVNDKGTVNFSVDNGIGDFSISTVRPDDSVSGPERPISKAGTAIKFNWSAPADWSVSRSYDLACADTMGETNGNGLGYFYPLQQSLQGIPADMVKPDSSWVCHLKMTAPKPKPPPPQENSPKLRIGVLSTDAGGSFAFNGDNGWQRSVVTTQPNTLAWSAQQSLTKANTITRIRPEFMDSWNINTLSCAIRGGSNIDVQRFADGGWDIPASALQSNKEIDCQLGVTEKPKASGAKFRMTLTSVNATGRVNFSVDNGIGDFSISTVRSDELVSGPERPISKAGTAIKFNWSAPADWSVPGQNDLKCMDTMGASNGNGLQYFLPLQQGLQEIPADMVKPDSNWVCHLKMSKPQPPPPQENSPKLRIGVLSTDTGGSFAFNGDNGWQRSVVTTQPNTLAWSAQQSLSKANTITRIRPEFMDSWNINTLTCSVRGGSNIDVQRFADGGWDIPASALQNNKEIDCQLGVTEKPKASGARFRMTLTSVNATGRVNFSVDNGIGDFSISTLRSDELVSGPERPISKAGTAIKFNWSAPADWSVPGQYDLMCMDTMGASNGNGLQYFLPLQQGLKEIPADMVKPDSNWVCHLKMSKPKPPPPPVKGVRLVLELITKNGVGIFEFAGTNGWNTINIQTTEQDKPVSSAIQTLAAANTDILLVPKSPEPQSNWTFHSAAGSCSSSDVSVGQFTPDLSGNLLLIAAKYVKNDALIRCSLTASKKPEKSTQLRLKLKRLGTANGRFSISGDNGWQTWQQDGPQDEVISEYQFLPAGQPLKLTLATEPAGGIIKTLSCLDENAVNSNNPPDSFNPTLIEQNSWQLAAFYMKSTAQFTCSVGIEYPLPLLKPATLSLRAIATGARAAQPLSFEYTGSNGWQARSFATNAADLPSDADVQQLTQAITTTLTLVKDQGWSLKQVECLDSNAANSGNTSLKFEPQVMNGSWSLPAPYIKPGAELMCDMTHRYAGYPLRGFVLHDNGIGGGTAHDGRRNGQEAGMAKMPVSLDNCRGQQFDHALSNAMGEFVLDAGLAEPGQVCLRQHLPDALSLVSVHGGTTSARYDAGNQAMTFILKPKSSYQDVLFGNVSNSLLAGSGQQQIPAGKSVSYAHIYTAASTASVRFSTPYTADASGNPGWLVSLMLDHNCNAVHDAADQPVQAAQVFQVTAGQQICLLQRVQSPVQALPAKRYLSTLVATESLSPQAGSGLREILRELRTDNLTEISNAGESLKLSKQVRQVGSCPSSAADTNPFTTSNQVIPGAFVEYLLSYRNVSDQPLRSLLIADAVPAYTVFKYAGYDSLAGTGLAGCDIRQPAKDTEGTISWAMIDDAQGQAAGGIGLQPGMGGAVRYCVQVLR